jgi:ribosomal protein L11 methyltransferase
MLFARRRWHVWFEVRVEADAEEAELLSEFFFDLGAVSVSTQDADLDTPDEQPLYGEPGLSVPNVWTHNVLTALFSPPATDQGVLEALRDAFPDLPRQRVAILEVQETDWVKHVQEQFSPIQVSQRLWIVPSWCEAPTDPDVLVLHLDPGLAFGTGSHPTTRLCLRWLDRHPLEESSVLDYGCGSGILAIAASKLGAQRVAGVDIDPLAVQAAQSNASINGVDAVFVLPEPQAPLTAEVVVANILANPLKQLAELLCSAVQPGGWLVLSGILEDQANAVAEAYRLASHGQILLKVQDTEEGWVCLVGQRLAQ